MEFLYFLGLPIETTIDNTSTVLYVGGMMVLEDICTSMIRDVDPENQLLFMRVRTRRFELMMAKGEFIIT